MVLYYYKVKVLEIREISYKYICTIKQTPPQTKIKKKKIILIHKSASL